MFNTDTVRILGGRLKPRYSKLIPFFKKILKNYQALKWYHYQHLLEGSPQEKREALYWLKDDVDASNNVHGMDPDDLSENEDVDLHSNGAMTTTTSTTVTSITTTTSSDASIFSSAPTSRASTPGLSMTTSSTATRSVSTVSNPSNNSNPSLPCPSQPVLRELTQMDEMRKMSHLQRQCSTATTSTISSQPKTFQMESKAKLTALIAFHRPWLSVMDFIKSFLHRIFRHSKHWGFTTYSNRQQFQKFLWRLITAQRHEKFTMQQVMGTMSPNILFPDTNTSVHSLNSNHFVTVKYMDWLLTVIMDLLRCNYYITERSHIQGPIVTYYPVKIWRQIERVYLRANAHMFQPISKTQVWSKKQASNLGIGFLRFVPKPTSLRPIINLSRDSILYDPQSGKQGKGTSGNALKPSVPKRMKAPNKGLLQLFSILKHQVERYKNIDRTKKQDILGSSVFCVREYYRHWILFTKKYKKLFGDPADPNLQKQPGRLPKVYCVSADLSKCYDRINQDVLMKIVERKLLYKETYHLLRYSSIVPEVGSMFQRYKWAVDHREIQDVAKDSTEQKGPFIVCNQGYRSTVRNEAMMQLLRDHVSTSIVYLNGKYYQNNVGISQGSIVSQLLCCVYIAQAEKLLNRKLSTISKRKKRRKRNGDRNSGDGHSGDLTPICRLMMRHVDDFIFYTTNKREAQLFADILHRGIDEYNMKANAEKTCTNFGYQYGDHRGSSYSQTTNHWISWCGFLWNTKTLNVRAHHRDHTLDIKSHLMTTSLSVGEGQFMKRKLEKLIRHKIEPLLLDGNINTLSNVIYNLYQCFYVSGARFTVLCKSLPMRNEYFLWNLLMDLIQSAYHRIGVLKKVASVGTIRIQFPMTKRQMQYVAGRGYQHSIMRKYHGLFSREFQRKLKRYIWLKSKHIDSEHAGLFEKYTDCNQLMHEKLNEFKF